MASRCYSGKVDLGTGVRTALTQIVADELDVPFARVKIIEGDTLLTPDQGPTYGSLSIQIGGMQIRQAARPRARHSWRSREAPERDARSEVATQDGACVAKGQRVAYGELIGRQGVRAQSRRQGTG